MEHNGENAIHEYCWDSDLNTGDDGVDCRVYCDSDVSCRGYDFKSSACVVYTTSSCANGFTKYNIGNTGEFIPDGYSLSGWSGCYKKIESMLQV